MEQNPMDLLLSALERDDSPEAKKLLERVDEMSVEELAEAIVALERSDAVNGQKRTIAEAEATQKEAKINNGAKQTVSEMFEAVEEKEEKMDIASLLEDIRTESPLPTLGPEEIDEMVIDVPEKGWCAVVVPGARYLPWEESHQQGVGRCRSGGGRGREGWIYPGPGRSALRAARWRVHRNY